MKSILILFISLFFLSCSSKKEQLNIESCPQVLFLKESKIYVTTEDSLLTYDNISYKAEINNYNFNIDCQVSNNVLNTKLSLLFIVKPEKAIKARIVLPYFIAVLNNKQNIIDIQYYTVLGSLNKDIETSLYIETEISDSQAMSIPYKDVNTGIKNKILIGFMLDNEKLKILY